MKEKPTMKEKKFYLTEALKEGCSNGDVYITVDKLLELCWLQNKTLRAETFHGDLSRAVKNGSLVREGRMVYEGKLHRYENFAAGALSEILRHPGFPAEALPELLTVEGVTLCEEQRAAVATALSHRLTLILGGAGCGKSTLIRGICDHVRGEWVLCAPTGKAARNLAARTGLMARTVHSALGMAPDDDFLTPVRWRFTKLVIVDEASMLSLEMLAGILKKANEECLIVLLGDPNQLLSVDSGNVIPDLLALGIPTVRLQTNHRQDSASAALLYNVVNFSRIGCGRELQWDESFVLHPMQERAALQAAAQEASERYLAGENVQVLAPLNKTVRELNQSIREMVNPLTPEKSLVKYNNRIFRDGDRVMITRNNREKDCSNGDVGILRILDDDEEHPVYTVLLPDGRHPIWYSEEDEENGLEHMTLAYALTVHKSQGSEYDAVLIPLTMGMSRMLSRNLFYTGISRGKRQVILYGSPQAVDVALQYSSPPRRSKLVVRTNQRLMGCA